MSPLSGDEPVEVLAQCLSDALEEHVQEAPKTPAPVSTDSGTDADDSQNSAPAAVAQTNAMIRMRA